MPRYLVTGAAGFIGARVSELLVGAGHEVVGVDNLNDAYDPRVKHHRLERLKALPRFCFAELDIARPGALETPVLTEQPIDAVVNLAARAGVRQSVENPAAYVETNVRGTLELLELCRRREIRKFVLASTSSLYGTENPRPYREDADTNRPLSPYAASKKGAEAICHPYHALFGIDVTILRYFTVYGPAGRPDMSVFRFVQRIREGRPIVVYGDGKQSRDFTYVDDVSRGTVASIATRGFEVINLGGDEPHELTDLIARIEARVGRKAEIERRERHPADVLATWADIDKARRLLSWQPEVSLDEGVERAVEWYEAERGWAREVTTD